VPAKEIHKQIKDWTLQNPDMLVMTDMFPDVRCHWLRNATMGSIIVARWAGM
jgi:hypothetical protein